MSGWTAISSTTGMGMASSTASAPMSSDLPAMKRIILRICVALSRSETVTWTPNEPSTDSLKQIFRVHGRRSASQIPFFRTMVFAEDFDATPSRG